jgi:predicted PurR-regulated permease PerM
VTSAIIKLLRLVSFVICLIVIASFVAFAVVQTKSASGHQGEQAASPTGQAKPIQSGKSHHEGSVRKALDEASAELTSPFDGLFSSSSEWATRGVNVLLTLIVYGFGLGYIARVLRVRV